MASLESVFVAGLVHLFFRFALYITPQSKFKTPGSPLPTIIVGVAILDLIYDSRIVPLSLRKRSWAITCICESMVAIFILEVGMLIFWQAIEHTVYVSVKTLLLGLSIISNGTYYRNETYIIGTFTLPLSLAILVIVARNTNRWDCLYQRYKAQQTHVHLQLDNTVNFLNSTDRYKQIRLREALEKYNSTDKDPPEYRSDWVKYFQNNM